VVTFSSDDNTLGTFTIAEEDFQVLYTVEQATETGIESFESQCSGVRTRWSKAAQ
jgi:hypothetical protein